MASDLLDVLNDFSPKLLSSGDIRMACPFRENHKDGSGRMSFFISPGKGVYHCFSCGAKGSAVNLLTTMFRVPYFEAVEYIRLVEYAKKKEVFDLDISWVIEPPKAFLNRGFSSETLNHFRFGILGEWTIIPFYKSFSPISELVGYQKRKDFPERIVSNIHTFSKVNYLYNYDTSFEYTVLVEGYSDVMRLYQFGYNATGLLGTSISQEQKKMLSKFKRIYLALDNDFPGRVATEKAVELLKNDVELLLVPYSSKDPGDCKSKLEWEKFFVKSTDYLQYTLEMSIHWDDYLDMKEKALKAMKEYD